MYTPVGLSRWALSGACFPIQISITRILDGDAMEYKETSGGSPKQRTTGFMRTLVNWKRSRDRRKQVECRLATDHDHGLHNVLFITFSFTVQSPSNCLTIYLHVRYIVWREIKWNIYSVIPLLRTLSLLRTPLNISVKFGRILLIFCIVVYIYYIYCP